MEAKDRVKPPAPEGVDGQPLPGTRERNGEAQTREGQPVATVPRLLDYCVLTGRGVPRLPRIRHFVEPVQQGYSVLTGRNTESSSPVMSIRSASRIRMGPEQRSGPTVQHQTEEG